MKKKILITLVIIVVAIIAIIGCFLVFDFIQEGKLKQELYTINEISNTEPLDINAIDEKLNNIVTKGDYAIVEDACKTYLRDCFDNILQITDTLNDEQLVNLLTPENYVEDGKEFTKSKEYIKGTRTSLEICKQKYTEFLTEEKAMSYINDKGLDEYYIDLYKQEFVGDMSKASNGEVESSIDEIVKILDISENVLNLLSENPNSWEMQGEDIVFNKAKLLNEYNELIDQL